MNRTESSPSFSPTAPDHSKRSETPVLLPSLASAILMNRVGEITLPRETRGAVMDWGGVYAQCVRLTGAWPVTILRESSVTSLGSSLQSVEVLPWKLGSHHSDGPLDIEQEVVPVGQPPGALRTLRLRSTEAQPIPVRVETEILPFLMPVLVEGIRPTRFLVETTHSGLVVSQHGFGFQVDADPLPSHLYVNRASWIGGRYEGEVDTLGFDLDFVVHPNFPTTLRWMVWGGLHRTITDAPHAGGQFLAGGGDPSASLLAAWSEWRSRIPLLRFPEAPKLETGYRFAADALRLLYSNPEPELYGLVAGFPWYSALWGRDLAWMLPAVLWMGDSPWTERSLATIFRFQATQSIPVLGAEVGELPMQISPGPIFLYGTPDTTLYYPEIVRRLLRHRGFLNELPKIRSALQEIARWGYRKCDSKSGLLTHGGEAEEIALATRPFGTIHYGFDAVDTTIWDSADRRDHAIDVQVLWIQALRAMAEMAPLLGLPGGPRYARDAERVADEIRSRYPWAEEEYLVDSLRADQPVRHVRPNALRAVSAGLFPPTEARAMVRRAARSDLTTGWGIRTLASSDAQYDPATYHDGQVWSIATAWGADAALTVGDPDLGVRYLEILSDRYIAERGFANECYRGDRPEPFNSCFLLGFSVAPFLTTLFERLWGLEVDAQAPSLKIDPRFPAHWKTASMDRLAIGGGMVKIEWTPRNAAVTWSGSKPLVVISSVARIQVAPGSTAPLLLPGEGTP